MSKSKSIFLLFGIEILALASFLWHQSVAAFVGWGKNWFYLHILLLIALIALFGVGLYKLCQHIVRTLSTRTGRQSSELFCSLVLALTPLLLLFLIFFQYFVFLKDIRGYLLPVSLAGSFYLVFVLLSRLKSAYPQAITYPKIINTMSLNQLSSKRLAWLIFIISLPVYIIYSTGLIFPPQPFTGDEPHYLLTTKSILKDGDINVFNNYRDKDYLDFYPGELTSHAFPGKKGDEDLYSRHFIALSVLLVPTYALGEKVAQLDTSWTENPETKRKILVFFARLPMCLFTALFGLVLFLLVLDITHRKDVSVLVWAVFSFTSPILFFSHLLYPEIPVALITIFVFRYFVLKKETNSLFLFLAGAGIGILPWFGVKYLTLSAILFGASAVTFVSYRKTENIWRRASLFLSPIVVSAGLYSLFFWVIYGNLSPISVYRGVSQGLETQVYTKKLFIFSFYKILSRSLGYFIDQKFGILIYTPLYILGFAGLYFYLKKKRREASLLLAVLSLYWIFSAIKYWGGHCPPGRPIISVLWILVLFLAIALAEKQGGLRKTMKNAGIALSLLIVWGALKDPWIFYHEQYASELGGEFLFSKLTRALSNSFVQFHNLMPSLKELEVLNWLTLAIWIIAICIIVVIYIKKTEKEEPQTPSFKIVGHVCFVFLFSSLLLTYVFFDIHIDKKEVFEGQKFELCFQDDNHFGKEIGGFWTKGERKTSVILKSPQPLSTIHLTLNSSVEGVTSVQVGSSKKKMKRMRSTGLSKSATFTSIKGFPMRKGYMYYITIKDSSGFVPYQLDRNVKDNRYLGVFVQIKTTF